MNDPAFIYLLDLLMCDDPARNGGGHEHLSNWADGHAVARGFDGWIAAYHEMRV